MATAQQGDQPPKTQDKMRSSTNNRPVVYLPTVEAYDRWAEVSLVLITWQHRSLSYIYKIQVYDTDNNVLQAIDTQELETLLPRYLSLIRSSSSSSTSHDDSPPLKIVDLGCGTGRNTLRLLESDVPRVMTVVGLDASPKMLDIARQRCCKALSSISSSATGSPEVGFEVFDAITATEYDDDRSTPSGAREADGVLSTLVLEHLPLRIFFRTVRNMLRVGGHLLLTNMHPDMGARSQAGFVDPVSGEKVRPQSFVYGIDEVLQEAARWGLRLVGEVRQRGVRESDVDVLGDRSRKWVGTMVWFGIVLLNSRENV